MDLAPSLCFDLIHQGRALKLVHGYCLDIGPHAVHLSTAICEHIRTENPLPNQPAVLALARLGRALLSLARLDASRQLAVASY
jgi:hypothetical protein